MEPTLQGLGTPPAPMSAAPSPMMSVAGQPQMQARGAMQPQQSQVTPQMLMMIRQHVMRQALMQQAIQKAKLAGVRDAQRKMAAAKSDTDPEERLGQAQPNDPAFGAGDAASGGNYQFSNNPGR